MSSTDRLPQPHFNNDMPPLPPIGATGPQVCATIRLYLAIADDLTPEEVTVLNEHVRICPECAKAQRLLQNTTDLFNGLPSSTPSSRVDQAVMAAIAARNNGHVGAQFIAPTRQRQSVAPARPSRVSAPIPTIPTSIAAYTAQKSKRSSRFVGKPLGMAVTVLAVAAMLFLVLSTTLHFLGVFLPAQQWTFSLPNNLSWNSYVLYHSETRIDDRGKPYRVTTYNNLGSGNLHVETVMVGVLDVVAIGTASKMLGLDMMHRVAQWGAEDWSSDESMFNLAALRDNLAHNRDAYLDKETFRGEQVYRIRCSNGLVLLLNMRYQPVNVLRGATGPNTGTPIYDTLEVMPASSVSSSMWDISVPSGFTMGTLPKRP
jgi:hypothetical protein